MFRAILLAVVCFIVSVCHLQAAPKGSRWGANYFPNFKVVDQHGKSYRFYRDLVENKIVVINFIYTHCPDICGLQTARMAIVQERLGKRLGRDLFIYSISLDPKRDTPEVLKQYSEAFGAKPGWLFLTGDPAEVHQIRYKLGERSRKLSEHRNDAVLGNDRTGEWGRSSMMANLQNLTQNIIEMDPKERDKADDENTNLASASPRHRKLGKRRGQALYLKLCSACHSIGMGRRIGPDLEGVTSRRDHEWLSGYMIDPVGVRSGGDAIAMGLRKSYPGVYMPDLGLAKTDAGDLIAYLRSETARLKGDKQAGSDASHKGNHAGGAHKH